MMEKCSHVSKIRPAWDHSILNPQKWMCYLCGTTESVWACLSCANVACGRFNEKHALNHFMDSKHPISIEVNEKYIYCYVCDDYVMNDNAAGDLKLLRSALSAIATQKFTDMESRGRRLLRSYSHTGAVRRDDSDNDDKLATAIWHQRQALLGKVFGAWRGVIQQEKSRQLMSRKHVRKPPSIPSPVVKKRTIIPGVTGLRNLGNTCYMNSILQVLSHIDDFRDFFLKLRNYDDEASPQSSPPIRQSPSKSPAHSTVKPLPTRRFYRQSTIDCFQHLMSSSPPVEKPKPASQKKRSVGLNGGSTKSTPVRHQLICDVESKLQMSKVSLCEELHGLLRVLWSGKWAQVSPHAFLRAVWQAIPWFKGYAQHDAQEFLCELLDKVQRELDAFPKSSHMDTELLTDLYQGQLVSQSSHMDTELLTDLYQGQLVSQVTCLSCGNVSQTYEPFMDLSLEFPNRYQITKQNCRVAQDIYHITEMLAKFTEEERLEGRIYACEKCNLHRRKSASMYTEAKKQLLINKLPCILRLHLKRFRWSGRDHREKISTHVATDEILDIRPFCSPDVLQTWLDYKLFGVIVHHGRGFGSGHYTALTWNEEAGSWVSCNDSRMTLCHLEEVLTAQAYILFYSLTPVTSSQSGGSWAPTSPPPLISFDSDQTVELSMTSEDSDSFVMIGEEELTNSLTRQDTIKVERFTDAGMDSMDGVNSVNEGSDYSDTSVSRLKTDGTMETIDNEVSFNFKPPSLRSESKRKRSLDTVAADSSDVKRVKRNSEEDVTSGINSTADQGNMKNRNLQLFNKLLQKDTLATNKERPTHKQIKRRKSTFW